jgi:predicted ribonuclease YlaK
VSKKFYDTNALLKLQKDLLKEDFCISSVSLHELEHIKVSKNKDDQIKCKARKVIHILDENSDKYTVVVPNNDILDILSSLQLESNPDNLIIGCAKYYNDKIESVCFVSDDICCRTIARDIAKIDVSGIKKEIIDDYRGYLEVSLNEENMAKFYENLQENTFNLLINEYLVIKNENNEIVDCYRWDGETYIGLYKKPVKSIAFGDKLKPKDVYQNMVIDSITHNTITVISGKAGSGKSLLSLMCAMHLIESGKYDRLVVMFNPTKTRGSSDLGFYAGTFVEKAMQNSIGQILTTKFGDRYAVDVMLQQEKIKLISMADARGVEIRDNEILYITECQNTSVELLKLCLSRASSGCKIIIEGDYNSQVDSYSFDGDKNGMRRAIDILKNEDIFGYVELQNVHRSKIAALVDKM